MKINTVTDLDIHFASRAFEVLIRHAMKGGCRLLTFEELSRRMQERFPYDRIVKEVVGYRTVERRLFIMEEILRQYRYPNLNLLVKGSKGDRFEDQKESTGSDLPNLKLRELRAVAMTYHWDQVDHDIFYDKSIVTEGEYTYSGSLRVPKCGFVCDDYPEDCNCEKKKR